MHRLLVRMLDETGLAQESALLSRTPERSVKYEMALEASGDAKEIPMSGLTLATIVYIEASKPVLISFNRSMETRPGTLFVLADTDIETITVTAPEGATVKVFLGGKHG